MKRKQSSSSSPNNQVSKVFRHLTDRRAALEAREPSSAAPHSLFHARLKEANLDNKRLIFNDIYPPTHISDLTGSVLEFSCQYLGSLLRLSVKVLEVLDSEIITSTPLKMTQTHQREAIRYELAPDFQCSTHFSTEQHHTFSTRVANISSSGCQLHATNPLDLKMGQMLYGFEFWLGSHRIQCDGDVRYIQRTTPDNGARIGVKFHHLLGEIEAAITRWINDQIRNDYNQNRHLNWRACYWPIFRLRQSTLKFSHFTRCNPKPYVYS